MNKQNRPLGRMLRERLLQRELPELKAISNKAYKCALLAFGDAIFKMVGAELVWSSA